MKGSSVLTRIDFFIGFFCLFDSQIFSQCDNTFKPRTIFLEPGKVQVCEIDRGDLARSDDLQPLGLKFRQGSVDLVDQHEFLVPYRHRTGDVLDLPGLEGLHVRESQHIFKQRLGGVVRQELPVQRLRDFVGDMRLDLQFAILLRVLSPTCVAVDKSLSCSAFF